MPPIKVFHYIPKLDAFVFETAFRQVSDYLGLTEWHPGVWLGRLFVLDNDFGEHCEVAAGRFGPFGA